MSSDGVIAISPICKEFMVIPSHLHSQESILIYVAMSGSMVPMRVLEYDSIDSVKLQIQTCKGFVVKNQKLVCGGREFARSNSLIRDYGVGDANVLHLVLKLSDLQVINLKTASGEEFTFNVDRSRDVGYVKRQIANKKGALVDIDEQEVLCDGERLEYQRLINDLCKSNDAVIHLFVRKSAKIRARPVEKNFELSIVAPQLNDKDGDERGPRFMQLLKEELFSFWKRQKEEILRSDPKRKHELTISRIRRAMKSNDQVKMVSAHSTVLFSKAIEVFILELTLRAWMQADQVKRRTLERNDFAMAIRDEELFDFLSPLQTYKFQVEEANGSQGNEFYSAYQMIQPNDIPYQFQVEEANDVQGNKFHLADQMVQPHNIPLQQLYQFQVGGEANDGHGNEFDPAYQFFQPNDILVEGDADDGQDNEFHPAYQMVLPDNIPCEFQVQKKANYGLGNEFQARELKILSEALIKGVDLPAYQMVQPNNIPCQYQVQEANDGQGNEFHPAYQTVQPNNIPASFISIEGTPAPLMLPPLINLSPEAEFNIDEFLVDNEEDLKSTESN